VIPPRQRSQTHPMEVSSMWPDKQPDPYVKVTVGSAVQTLDDKRVGVVAEIRGDHFKIKTGWWQQDFWMRADRIQSAVPDHNVVLNVDKAHLEGVKICDVPPAD
jgi:hypothetical protein